MILPRRTLITGLAAMLAAPAVVRARSIMPVAAVDAGPPPIGFPSWGSYHNIVAARDGLRQALISPHAMRRECEALFGFLSGVQWEDRGGFAVSRRKWMG